MKIGLALCCGKTPEKVRQGFRCSVCGLEKGAWGGGVEFEAHVWNQSFHKTSWNVHGEHWSQRTLVYHDAPALDVGGDWKYGVLEYAYHPPYGDKLEQKNDFCIFRVPGRSDESLLVSSEGYGCIIDDSRCVQSITLRSINGMETTIPVPQFKRMPMVQIFITRGWCTDQTWWYTVHITTRNQKWHNAMMRYLCLNLAPANPSLTFQP